MQISLTCKGSRVGYPATRGAGPTVGFSVACEVFQVLGERSLERCTASESSLFLNAQFWNNEIIMGCLKSDFQMSNKLILKYGYLFGGDGSLKFFKHCGKIHITVSTILTVFKK